MSRVDRTNGAARPWRLLSRALVVAGATVAGTSAAWLVGAGFEADAAKLHPADESAAPSAEAGPERSTVDDPPGARSGPADFSLGRLNPLALVRSGPAERLLDTARPVTGALRHSSAEVEQVAAGVEQVAGDALSATSSKAGTLSESVNNGLPDLAAPLLSEETGPAPVVERPEPPAPTPGSATAVSPQPAGHEATGHGWSSGQIGPAARSQAPEPADETPAIPGRSRPFVLPAPPGAPGCGGAADGPQHNNSVVGWYPVESDRTPAFAGPPTRDTAGTLIGVPEPQPGTTPD